MPRLLVNSDRDGDGLGNCYDKIGRYYGCHFEHNCGRLVPNGTAVAFIYLAKSTRVA